MLLTKIDKMVELIRKNPKTTFQELGKPLSMDAANVERIARILENAGVMDIHYPLNPLRKPWITLRQVRPAPEEKMPPDGKVETYTIKDPAGGYGVAQVEIYASHEEDRRNRYFVSIDRLSPFSRAFLEYVKREMTRALPLSGVEKTKDELQRDMLDRTKAMRERLARELGEKEETLDRMTTVAVNEMYGLGDIEILVDDQFLEEIIINSAKVPISVYHRKHGWLKTNLSVQNEEDIENYSAQIARKVGRQITVLNPVLDAHLISGDRVNATLYPISTAGNSITLRLFARNPWTIVSLISDQVKSMSTEMAALVWQAVHYEMNVIVSGGTASGKTSALNSIIALIPPHQRIITIEDTRELVLPKDQWNWVPLATREPNPEGLGEVTMLDLVVNSLRMRPDRIVMGEIRRKREAEVLFEAMHTGHSVYGTLHADTAEQVIKRLIEPPIEVPPGEVEDVHLIMVQYRDRRMNLRRTLELSEVIPGVHEPTLNHLYKWRPRGDTFDVVRPAHRYIEQMNLHTGMTEKEIADDQENKDTVLKWMLENKLVNVDDVGKVMEAYYADEASLLKGVEKKLKPAKVLGG